MDIKLFNSKIDRTGGECWIWTGYRDKDGYGIYCTSVNGKAKKLKAHRIVFEHVNGLIPPGKIICHTCDNPSCCNPEHLYAGTFKTNSEDMHRRGRNKQRKGEKHPSNKGLTEEMVREIRRLYTGKYGEIRDLSKKFGIKERLCWKIVHKKLWRHVI